MVNPRHRLTVILLSAALAFMLGMCFAQQPTLVDKQASRLAQRIQDFETNYVVANAYRGMGYLDAGIQLNHVGGKDVLEVTPGEKYHFGRIDLLGVPHELATQMMRDPDAPRLGQVYSAITVNMWVASVKKNYADAHGLKVICQSSTNDRARHVVNIVTRFQSADLPAPSLPDSPERGADFCRTGM